MQVKIQHVTSYVIYGADERAETSYSSDISAFFKLRDDLKASAEELQVVFEGNTKEDYQFLTNTPHGPKFYGGGQEITTTIRTISFSASSAKVFHSFMERVTGLVADYIKKKGWTLILIQYAQQETRIETSEDWYKLLSEIEK